MIALVTLAWTALSVWLLAREMAGRAECALTRQAGVVVEVTSKYRKGHWPTSTHAEVVLESERGERATVDVGGGSARLLPAGTTLEVCVRRGGLDIAARRGERVWTTAMAVWAGLAWAALLFSWAARRDPWLGGVALFSTLGFLPIAWFALMIIDGLLHWVAKDRPVGALDVTSMDLPHVIAVPIGGGLAIIGFVLFLKDLRSPRGRPIWKRVPRWKFPRKRG